MRPPRIAIGGQVAAWTAVALSLGLAGCGSQSVEPPTEASASMSETAPSESPQSGQIAPASMSLPGLATESPRDRVDEDVTRRPSDAQEPTELARDEASAGAKQEMATKDISTTDLKSDSVEPQAAPAATEVSREPYEELYPSRKPKVQGETVTLSDGKSLRDGPWASFYADGQQFEAGNYARGKRTGEWKYFFQNGELSKSGQFVDGQPDGTWQYRREDGSLEREESYQAGVRHGAWRSFDRMERPLKLETYEKGIRQGETITWFVTGQMATEENYRANELHGISRTWHENGIQATEQSYEQGKLHGRSTSWSPDGEVLVELQYEKGRVLGRAARTPGP